MNHEVSPKTVCADQFINVRYLHLHSVDGETLVKILQSVAHYGKLTHLKITNCFINFIHLLNY